MIGRRLLIGPSLTLAAGYQSVPLDAVREYGARKVFIQASTAAAVTLSTNAEDSYILKASTVLELDMDGAPWDLSRGSELVTNGTFASAAGWTAGTGWAIAGGTAAHASGTTLLKQTITTLKDDTNYEVKYKIIGGTGNTGGVTLSLGGFTLAASPTGAAGEGTHTQCMRTSNITGPLRITPSHTTSCVLRVDNISVKEVTARQVLYAKGTAGVILQVMFTI